MNCTDEIFGKGTVHAQAARGGARPRVQTEDRVEPGVREKTGSPGTISLDGSTADPVAASSCLGVFSVHVLGSQYDPQTLIRHECDRECKKEDTSIDDKVTREL
jgi:hypothetical protein